ncbi:hypothetical protein K0M31_015425 [Melipona bicolor]|uniref:Uncharacterized protein n=1 Tax=Melipona bicolor TaxID=60889 RepID=A0AA40FFC6_9HYME|nr:hypothetical protein K0M31_015425 [Melipona bicolor]
MPIPEAGKQKSWRRNAFVRQTLECNVARPWGVLDVAFQVSAGIPDSTFVQVDPVKRDQTSFNKRSLDNGILQKEITLRKKNCAINVQQPLESNDEKLHNSTVTCA